MSLKIYNYHPVTKEFIPHDINSPHPIADINPLDISSYILPGFSTDIEPPKSLKFKIPIFDKEKKKWSTVLDYRGWKGFDSKGEEQEITELREKPKKDWSIKKPYVLNKERITKLININVDFRARFKEEVSALDILWNGGFDTIIRLELLTRLAINDNLETIKFASKDNIVHKLTIEKAYKIIRILNDHYQELFLDKQNRLNIINKAKNKQDLEDIS